MPVDTELHDLWSAFRNAAETIVRDGSLVQAQPGLSARGWTKRLTLTEVPSFENVTGWQVYEQAQEISTEPARLVAVQTTWRHDIDALQFRTPAELPRLLRLKFLNQLKPTVQVEQFELDAAKALPYVRQIQQASVRLGAESYAIGLDGTFYELCVGGRFVSATLKWWEHHWPKEWDGVGTAAAALLALLRQGGLTV